MTDDPLVSICLLTWNRASVIRRSLDSLLGQTYKHFELIINDDCSNDATSEISHAYAAKDQRVRYCRNETNLKYSGNSNAAVERSRGEFIVFAHDGDYYHPELIEQWVRVLQDHPTAALAFCGLNVMNDSAEVVRTIIEPFPALINGQELLHNMLKRFDSPIFGITMVRRRCIDQVGKFDSRFPRITDVDMWLRLLAKFDAAYVNQPLIDVMPREKGHENSEVNWNIIQQLTEIRETNIRRAFDAQSNQLDQFLAKYRTDRRKLYLRSIAWCFYHGRIKPGFSGLMRLLSKQGG